MRDDWSAARRLVTAIHCAAVDNFVAVVDETDTAGRWKRWRWNQSAKWLRQPTRYTDQQPKTSWASDRQLRLSATGK